MAADRPRAPLTEVVRYGGEGRGIALGDDRSWGAASDTRAMARGLGHAGGRHRVVV